MNTSIISKLATFAFTILLATNLCGMESIAGKHRRDEEQEDPRKKSPVLVDFAMQTDETQEQRDQKDRVLTHLLKKSDHVVGTALHKAIVDQQFARAKDILDVVASLNANNINDVNDRNESPLCVAARKPDSRIVRLLVSQPDIHLNEPGEDFYTAKSPLTLAIHKGNDDAVRALCEAGASTRGKDKSNPLFDWCSNGGKNSKIALVFLEKGIDVNGENSASQTPLEIASTTKSPLSSVKFLLQNGANIFHRNSITGLSAIDIIEASDLPSTTKTYIQNEWRARLLNALATFHVVADLSPEIIEPIIAQILEITPNTLIKIIRYGSSKTAKRYLEKGFLQIETPLNLNATPLHIAAYLGKIDTTQLFLDYKANTEAKDVNGYTPLHSSIYSNQIETAKLLLEHDANIEAKADLGQTPLHRAARSGHILTTQLLLDYKANLEAKTDNGHTPLHYAANSGHIEAATLLLERGANVNARSLGGETPLHLACLKKHLSLIEFLQARGGDMTIKDNNGKTPQDFLDA